MKNKLSAAVKSSVASLIVIAATSHAATTSTVPENLSVPANQSLSHQVRAEGVQIYECKASKDDSSRVEWSFKAPEAELFNVTGKRIGKHYGGPTWEADDGSKVVGEVKARDNGPDANAIPWLLLSAKSASGAGEFGKIASIQRIDTVGGKAPGEGCDKSQIGNEARVPYTATYRFYVAKS